jgi:hypothetical protein
MNLNPIDSEALVDSTPPSAQWITNRAIQIYVDSAQEVAGFLTSPRAIYRD